MTKALKFLCEVALFVVFSVAFVALLPILLPVELFFRYREYRQLKKGMSDYP